MASLGIDCDVSTLEFHLHRGPDTPDEFWVQLTSRFMPDRRSSLTVVRASIDEFLSRRQWMRQACARWNVSLIWEDRARRIVGSQIRLSDEFAQLLADDLSMVEHLDIPALLSATRFEGELREFQQRDLAKLRSLSHGANYSVPGSGKTAVTYALYELERVAGRVEQLVIVGPLSAFEAWVEEAALWIIPSPSISFVRGSEVGPTEVLLINYQRISSQFAELVSHMRRKPTHLVLDEGHRIKRGWRGEWGSACLRLSYFAERRDVLTGTPAPNHPRDLEALVDFCWPGQGRTALPEESFSAITDAGVAEAAGRRLAPLFVRTTKDELELPPLRLRIVEAPLGAVQREIYAALRHQFAGRFRLTRLEETNLAEMGRIVMYLLEAASNPALLSSGSSDDDPLSFRHPPLEVPKNARLTDLIGGYGRYETPPKYVETARIIDDNRSRGQKTLVWSNFVRNLEWLRHRVLSGLQPAMIHGGVPMESGTRPSRQEELDRFRRDPDCWVLLANPAAMAEGVSLHRDCNSAVYVDRTFNAGQFLQSQDRIHRLGLPDGVQTTITILVTRETIDEVVNTRLAEKIQNLAALMQDPGLPAMSLPDEDEYGLPMDNQMDIAELFQHLRTG